jgi:hypothetical protein
VVDRATCFAIGAAAVVACAGTDAPGEDARSVGTRPAQPGVSASGAAICFGDDPAVVVKVRDRAGRPAAVGTSVVVRAGAFTDSVDGSWPRDSLRAEAPVPRAGRYDVRLAKPGYRPVLLRNVQAPLKADCHLPAPKDTPAVRLELLPGAPPVRSVVVFPPRVPFGAPGESSRLRAVVDADDGVSRAVDWTSSDTTVATVSPDGRVRARCQSTTRHTVVTATSVAAPHVQGRSRVTVERPNMDALGPASPARAEAAACLARLRAR